MNRQISLNEMSQCVAGSSKFWDGFCTGVAIIDAGWAFGLIALTPVGGAFIIGSTIGCAVREVVLQNE
jgi:hypothetical protein